MKVLTVALERYHLELVPSRHRKHTLERMTLCMYVKGVQEHTRRAPQAVVVSLPACSVLARHPDVKEKMQDRLQAIWPVTSNQLMTCTCLRSFSL